MNVPFLNYGNYSSYSFFIPAKLPRDNGNLGYEDPIFSELYSSNSNGSSNLIGDGTFITTVEDFQRGKRGALQLGQIMKCATGCNPLAYKGYGCYCGSFRRCSDV